MPTGKRGGLSPGEGGRNTLANTPSEVSGGGVREPVSKYLPPAAPAVAEVGVPLEGTLTRPYPEIKLPTATPTESIAQRLRSLSNMNMPRRRPFLVGSLVGNSSLSDYSIDQIATGLGNAVNWSDTRDALVGTPGYVSRLRTLLTLIPVNAADITTTGGEDPTRAERLARLFYAKEDALRFLDELAKLPEEQQSSILAILQGHPLELELNQRLAGREALTGLVEDFGGEVTTEGLVFDRTSAAAGIGLLFPNFPMGLANRTDDEFETLADALQAAKAEGGLFDFAGTPGDVLGTLDVAVTEGAHTAMLPFEAAGAVGGETLELVGGKVLRDIVGGGVRGFFSGLTKAGDIIIKPALRLGGVEPGDPGYDAAYQSSQFLFQVLVLRSFHKVARASKVSATAPDVVAAAELGLRGVPADYLRSPLTRVMWDLRGKSPEEWLSTRHGRSFMSDVRKIRAEGGDVAAALVERMGGMKMPTSLAQALSEALPDDVPRVFIDHMTNPGGRAATKPIKQRLDEIEDTLRTHDPAPAEPYRLDPVRLEVEADLIRPYLEFPRRAYSDARGEMPGRSLESTEALRRSLRERGYDENFVPEGETAPVGPVIMEVNPKTFEAIIREKHHRIGIQAEEGGKVPLEVRFTTERLRPARGTDIEDLNLSPAARALSELGSEGLQPLEASTLSGRLRDLITEAQRGGPTLRGSKVVTETGEPLRVYHGTKETFETFAPDAAQSGLYGEAFYFAEDPAVASGYSGGAFLGNKKYQQAREFKTEAEARSFAEKLGREDTVVTRQAGTPDIPYGREGWVVAWEYAEGGNQVRPVYLDIKRPFDTTKVMNEAEMTRILREGTGADILEGSIADEIIGAFREGRYTDFTGRDFYNTMADYIGPEAANQLLRSAGFDGIFHIGGKDGRVWIAFESSQIRVGIGRVGPPPMPKFGALTPEALREIQAEIRATEGGTWNPETGEFTRAGQAPPDSYGVAVNAEYLNIERPPRGILGEAGTPGLEAEILRVRRQYPEEFNNGAHVGFWENKAGNEVHVDPMRVIVGKEEALVTAAKTGQKAIYDYATGDTIDVPKSYLEKYAPKPRISGQQEISLRSERIALQQELRAAAEKTPMWRFPKKNVMRAALRHPVTKIERVLNLGMKPLGKVPEWLVDELPSYPTLFSPADHRRPVNWRDHNADVASKWLRRTGVKQAEIERILNDLIVKVKDGESFYEWMEDIGTTIDRALPKRTPVELRDRLTTIWDRPTEARTRSIVSEPSTNSMTGKPQMTSSYALRDPATGQPLPSMPTEFAQSVRLPSIDHAIEATSPIRRAMREVRKVGVGKANLGLVYDVPKFLLQASTAVLKPLVLVTRLPALVTRIQMEQFVRAWLHEGRIIVNIPGKGLGIGPMGYPIPYKGMRWINELLGEEGIPLLHGRNGIPLPENVGDLGMMMSSMMDMEGVPTILVEATSRYNRAGVAPKGYVFDGWAESLLQLRSDRLAIEMVRRGLNVEETAKWLETSEWGQAYMKNQQGPLLARSQFAELEPAARTRAWLEMKKKQIQQVTMDGNPELLDFIQSGKLRRGDIRSPKDPVTEGPIDARYLEVRDKIRELERTMGELDRVSDAARIRALDASRRRYLTEMKELKLKAKELKLDLKPLTKERVTDANRLRRVAPTKETPTLGATLRDKWERNELDLPEHVTVTKRVIDKGADMSIAESVGRMGDIFERIAYSGLETLSKADVALTRGSLYYDYYRRSAQALERQGWARKDIEAQATLRAAERTSDIMYDLSARTSVQRALKDLFWFAPAWQEIIYTWAVKIPSQYHWPIGAALLTAKGHLMMDLFRDLGVVQKDSYGEDIVVVPIPGFAEKMLGDAGIKMPDEVFFRTGGLNFVTSGGVFPGLSSTAGFLVGRGALKYGGIFKEISDYLQPFGPEQSLLPTPIIRAWELTFGEPPPFELFGQDWQQAQYDRTADLAIQYAYAELAEEGVKPPLITDFKSDEKYRQAFKSYWDRLFSLKDEYLRGIFFTKLAGTTVSPASLSVTSQDEQEWREFWKTAIEPGFKEGGIGFTEEQRSLIDDYLAEHPNSLAYSTFFTAPGEKVRDLPFTETEDDKVWDEYYTGERRYKTPEEFATTLAITETRRHLIARLDKQLEGVGDTASEQLLNGYQRQRALTKYLYDWDRFVETTPGAEAILDEQRALFEEKYGIPTRSYEQLRLAQTINQLNKLGKFFTNEAGMRTQEVKTVVGELKALYSETGEFGEPRTKVEKQRAWYFEHVLVPYIEKTSPLYEKAKKLDAAGLYAGDIYDRIRKMNDRYGERAIRHGGEKFPTPEEVFFGNRSPVEQQQALLSWATRPPAWLSNWQREQIGVGTWKGADEMLTRLSKAQDDFYQMLDKEDIHPSSKDYDKAKAALQREYERIAGEYGKQGRDLLKVQLGAPYERLEASVLTKDYIVEEYGQRAWNKWKAVTNATEYITTSLEKRDLSPKGYSEDAVYYKEQLYKAIQTLARQSDEFVDLMRDLSYAMPQDAYDHRSGALLFNALLFDSFGTQFVPNELTKAGKGII